MRYEVGWWMDTAVFIKDGEAVPDKGYKHLEWDFHCDSCYADYDEMHERSAHEKALYLAARSKKKKKH